MSVTKYNINKAIVLVLCVLFSIPKHQSSGGVSVVVCMLIKLIVLCSNG